jgi:hypothetical protein
MKTEQQKMLAGELYDPMDPELVAARVNARDICQALNATGEAEQEKRRQILQELFGEGGDSVWMQPPFFCDYGSNIKLGERVFFNFNCVVLDVCQVHIGSFTLFGPAVQIYTPMHPFNAEQCGTTERGVRQAGRDWNRRLGGRRGDHSAGRAHRASSGDRGRERGDEGHSRGRVCRRQPMPRYPRNH